jgi:hypothetical protein
VVLVDTSVWIGFLRGQRTRACRALAGLIPKNEAALAPVIYQEILQGAASHAAFGRLHMYFRVLPFLLPRHPIETYSSAGELYVRCRERGITPRSPHDCLVAQIAMESGVALLHDDRDFELLARVAHNLKLLVSTA